MVERGEGGGGGELVYQLVESPGVTTCTYEVSVPMETSLSSATNTVTQDEEYSTLKNIHTT